MKYFTKYFSESVLPYIENGSVRFGSLSSYRGEERDSIDSAARFSDKNEGLLSYSVNAVGMFEELNIPRFLEICGPANVNIANSNFNMEYHENVFCVSKGGYSKSHHHKMLQGVTYLDGLRYQGNPDLTHFAVYDAERFFEALNWLHPNNTFGLMKPAEWSCWALDVVYSEKDFRVFLHGPGKAQISSDALWYRAMKVKHPYFRVENEYRFVLDKRVKKDVQLVGDAKIITNSGVKASIVDIGSA